MLPSTKRAAFTVLALVTMTLPAHAQDRVIGLLTLPTVLGEGPCVRFEPKALPLYAGLDTTRLIATIEVDKNWIMHPNGGCDGLDVSVHHGTERSPLPTREKGYEEPAVIVLEQRNGWFRIRLSDRSAWVAPSPRHVFLPLEKLLLDYETAATTEDFSGKLRRSPGGAEFGSVYKHYQHVAVREIREFKGGQWLRVDVLSHSPCEGNINIEPFPIAKGWLPAHSESGEPTVWFFSRGC